MVAFRTFFAVLSVAVAVNAVPVKRTNHESEVSYEQSEVKAESSSEWKPEEPKQEWEQPQEAVKAEEAKPEEWKEEPKQEWEQPQEAVKAEEVYGSGSWDKSGYNDCVSQCMAQFGGGSAGVYEPAATAGATEGSVGDGATHTVIVAPSQGVLRYVPAFVNAEVGDTVLFKWGANNHTVTKGSALLPCNKTEDAPFVSGLQNKDFTFTQKVNSTDPTYFYCAAPNHCSKGMFGIINPGSAAGSNTSAGQWMPSHFGASNSSNSSSPSNSSAEAVAPSSGNATEEYSAYYSYTQSMVQNNEAAANWGKDVDMTAVPEWAREPLAANIMYTQNLIAMNPDMISEDGKISVGSDAPLMLPNDVSAVNNAASTEETAATTEATTEAATPESESANPVGAAAQNDQPASNGAASLTASKAVMGAAVVFATVFLL